MSVKPWSSATWSCMAVLERWAAIGGVVLHDGAVHLVDQVGDQVRVQVVAGGRLPGGELYRDALAGQANAQGVVEGYHRLRRMSEV